MCYITQVCTNFSFLCVISHRYDQFFIPMCYIKKVCTNFSFLRVMSNGFALTFHFYVLYHINLINSSFLCVISHRYTLTFHSYVLYHIGMNKFFVPVYQRWSPRGHNLKLQHLDVLRGRLLGSHVNFHWQLGGQNNHQPCSSNDISHCSSSQLSTELDSAVSSF